MSHHPLSLAYKFEQMDALGRDAQFIHANGRKCSCGYPSGPCLRSQTDCIAIQLNPAPQEPVSASAGSDGEGAVSRSSGEPLSPLSPVASPAAAATDKRTDATGDR